MKHYKDAQNNLFGFEDGDTIPAGLVEITMDEVRAIVAVKQQAEFNALTYAEKRATAYPSIADQLDTIYHNGIDAWKAEIAAVKTEYPKP
jgi:hypothetical protein